MKRVVYDDKIDCICCCVRMIWNAIRKSVIAVTSRSIEYEIKQNPPQKLRFSSFIFCNSWICRIYWALIWFLLYSSSFGARYSRRDTPLFNIYFFMFRIIFQMQFFLIRRTNKPKIHVRIKSYSTRNLQGFSHIRIISGSIAKYRLK